MILSTVCWSKAPPASPLIALSPMIESRYHHYFRLINDPTAAAILAAAEHLAGAGKSEALSPRQAAKELGVSLTTIYDLCHVGKLRSMKIGRAVRIDPNDLEDYRRNAVA